MSGEAGLRRDELLDVGAAMFAEKPYDEVLIEDVADRAGVTRSLMYHYFPNKRDFYIAIFQRASDRLLDSGNRAVGLRDGRPGRC